ncbi:helix-turn-helix domain-containing protein [Bradyrhizobium sp. Ai1a-2]|uniref:AraC family transcriptional regulator n=1 Tax=Bradyrhizobium sp. Ai1a-2 TaxID=196490 RepID=UPI000424BDDB|nr:helix-turn-helix domain-containing protein [Bradyrhizobium sp. Ai1a-2]
MAWSRVFDLSDPSQCKSVFWSADVELFPTAKGSFRAKIAQIGISRLLVQRYRVSLPQVNTVAVKPSRRSIGFLTEANLSAFLHCGLEVLAGDVVVNRSDVVHQRSGANLHYGTISLATDDFDAAVEAILGREFVEMPQKRIIRPHSAAMLRLLRLHKIVGQLAHDMPDVLDIPEVGRALENELTHVMVRCLAESAAGEPRTGSCRHDAIVARFEEFLEANPDRPLYLAEICTAIGVAERTLRASCEEHLGMGPIRYLTLRRMHLVRSALLRSDHSKRTVTQIVTDHGFWELGRFSVAYRTLFGEAPSRTLRRSVEPPETRPNRPTSLAAANLRAA